MFDVVSKPTETPAAQDPHLAEAGRPQTTTRPSGGAAGRSDAQTLTRALDLMFAIAEEGPLTLSDLQRRLGLTKSTTYRLASALVARRFLVCAERLYTLGPKLVELSVAAPDQASSPV